MSCVLLTRSLGGVFLDVVVTETHTSEMEIAEHPVERDAKISDHAWRLPRIVVLEAIVVSPAHIASWEALLQVQRIAEPFPIITGLRVYEDMLIKSLEASRDVNRSSILYFSATCREVIRVSTQTIGGAQGATTSRGQIQGRQLTPTNSAQASLLSSIGG